MNMGIVFDLDGTLLDTLEDLRDAANYALTRHGFPERSLAQLRRAVGNGALNQIRRLLPEGTPEETVQQVLATYKPYYTAHCQEKTAPYPGILPALQELGSRYALAIVSNKPDAAVKELCQRYFPGVYALGETADCPRKPAPDMVTKALKALGADRGIYVGDSEVDVLTARNSGIPCVSVLWGFRDRAELEQAGARYLCADAAEMVRTIRTIADGEAG